MWDQELLKNLSIDELEALANSTLIPKSQNQLQELLSKNTEATLSTEETHLLDHLLAQIDYLNILTHVQQAILHIFYFL